MTIRTQIVALFRANSRPAYRVRDILAVLGGPCARASVSKVCLNMAALGLLKAERVSNWHHGKCYEFAPAPCLLASLRGFSAKLVLTAIRRATRPLTLGDIRESVGILCGRHITKVEARGAVDKLTLARQITADRTSKYALYSVRDKAGVPWANVAGVLGAWGRSAHAG